MKPHIHFHAKKGGESKQNLYENKNNIWLTDIALVHLHRSQIETLKEKWEQSMQL